jgi:hypothetical protein
MTVLLVRRTGMSIPAAEETGPSTFGSCEDAHELPASTAPQGVRPTGILIGYARCSTERQDLAAARRLGPARR